MSTREDAPDVRRSDGNDVAVRLLALGWALAVFAVCISAAWSLLCSSWGNFSNPGGYLHALRNPQQRGMLVLAIGPLAMSVIYVAGLGIATWYLRARRRRADSESRSDDGGR